MKITRIENKVKLENRGYIRHRLSDMSDGDQVQRCNICGCVINDYTGYFDGTIITLGKEKYIPKGMAEGFVYVSVESNPRSVMHEVLKDFGAKMPEDYTDCSIINS